MRSNIQRHLAGALLVGLMGTAGCAVYVRAPRPPSGAVFVVREPPPLRREVIVRSPGRAYVWVEGNWMWRGADYVWVPGRWVLPPRARGRWVSAHWYHEPRGWFLIEGYWR